MNRIAQVSAFAMAAGVQAGYNWGGCPKVEPMQDFDLTKYQGQWYEIIRDELMVFSLLSGCVQAYYEINADGSVMVDNTAHYMGLGWFDQPVGQAVVSDQNPASLVVSFGGTPTSDERANYNIIDTDYDNYVIIYSCEEQWGGWLSTEYFWILARTPTIPLEELVDIVTIVGEKLPEYDFWSNYHVTRQGDSCPYDTMPTGRE